ncbi:hypothetical protein REPUB_Repub07fG0115500 [Reevesia pubescens]
MASQCEVVFNGSHGFEIELGERRYIVHLGQRTCSGRRYQLSGIPCAHAICAIREQGFKIEDYVYSWYHKEVYMLVYENVLNLIPDRRDWPKNARTEDRVLPPEKKNAWKA